MIDVSLQKGVPGFSLDVAFRNATGITALFGRSGSGKSMTLGLIAGLLKPDAGHVTAGDTTLVDVGTRCAIPAHKRRVGLVFQDSQLFPHLSVRHNLMFGRWFAPKHEREVDAEAVIETLGIGALLGRRPGGLSGGERQRVAIGRALLASPRLLLLDEPLASLDRPRKLEILPLIERLRDEFKIPIVYVSHALEEVVRLASHVVHIDQGQVLAAGEPAVVFGRNSHVEEPRFGRASVLTAVIGDTDERYGLTALRHTAGTLWLAGHAAPQGRRVQVVVHATDVSLTTGPVGGISIRTSLSGVIRNVEEDGPLALVDITLDGDGSLAALVTRRAAHDLVLTVGTPVKALVKTVALDESTVG